MQPQAVYPPVLLLVLLLVPLLVLVLVLVLVIPLPFPLEFRLASWSYLRSRMVSASVTGATPAGRPAR
jgi:hypothetical protein